jgi:predicted SAM-dependent methyltransferase
MEPAKQVKKRTLRKKLGLAYGPYKGVRLAIDYVRSIGKVNRILARKDQPIKLHIGSGDNYKDGWINIDLHPVTKKDLLHNLANGIPFPDNSVDFIYHEHFIEHLSYKDGFAFMNEAFRVLKPGGVMRISCPDLDFLVETYIKDNWRYHAKDNTPSQEWEKMVESHRLYPSKVFMLNQTMREDGGHQYLYNFAELAARLNEAGFFSHHIHEMQMNQSDYPDLQNIDWRGNSLIVEARKDRSFAENPLLTVVIPACNNEATIRKTLDSVLAQKTNFKFIVKAAEDGSKDGTQKILMEYREKHPDIIKPYMQSKSLGAEKALHRVLKTVDTEFIAFVGGGDYWNDPGKLQTQVDVLKANPDCVMSAHNTIVNDAAGNSKSEFVAGAGSKSRYGANDNIDVHPSSLVCRNAVSFPVLPVNAASMAALRSLYLAEGNLFFTDKVMSVHNTATPGVPPRKQRFRDTLLSLLKRAA